LTERRDITTLMQRALSKKRCVFRRNWSLGASMPFPEFESMREAAHLIRAETCLLAYQARFTEAIESQARGFRLAEQAASDPAVTAYVFGLIIGQITLSGYETILQQGGADPVIAEKVRQTISSRYREIRAQTGLRGEPASFNVGMNRLRRGGPAEVAAAGSEADEDQNADPSVTAADAIASWFKGPPLSASQMNPTQLKIWHDYLDAGEAEFIRNLRELNARSTSNGLEQVTIAGRMDARWKQESWNPVSVFSAILIPAFAESAFVGLKVRARERTLRAGASVLIYHARNGTFPKRLTDTLPNPPKDPFTGTSLGYHREGGGFVIYSVGPTGAFDGGVRGERPPGGAAVFRYPRS
jgi:hypothetical protein